MSATARPTSDPKEALERLNAALADRMIHSTDDHCNLMTRVRQTDLRTLIASRNALVGEVSELEALLKNARSGAKAWIKEADALVGEVERLKDNLAATENEVRNRQAGWDSTLDQRDALSAKLSALEEVAREAFDVLTGLNDDEVNEEFLPRLRALLHPTVPVESTACSDCEDHGCITGCKRKGVDPVPVQDVAGLVEEALGRDNELAKLPALIMQNIEEHEGWLDSAALITARAHAYVLHYDLPDALLPVPPSQGADHIPDASKMVAQPHPDVKGLVEGTAKAIAENGFGRPWDDFLAVNAHDTDQGDLTAYAQAACDFLAARREERT